MEDQADNLPPAFAVLVFERDGGVLRLVHGEPEAEDRMAVPTFTAARAAAA